LLLSGLKALVSIAVSGRKPARAPASISEVT
jgi:hypothetical protein